MKQATLLFAFVALWACPTPARAEAPDPKTDPTALREYCRRMADINPLDAGALFDLGSWCREQGLDERAIACFEEVIRLDSDHSGARAALGYTRYGTGWRREGAPQERPEGTAGEVPAGGSAGKAANASTPEAPSSGTAVPSAAAESPPAADASATTTTASRETAPAPSEEDEAQAAAARLDKKLEWAKVAEKGMQVEFYTFQDKDFLVHSTLQKNATEVKQLVLHLRAVKKALSAVLGTRSRTSLWPDKLQLVLLRSELEYERFGELVDSVRNVKNPDGAYVFEDHIVLWKPESDTVTRVACETALNGLGGKRHWVPWWLTEGVAELVVNSLAKENEAYRQAYEHAAEYIETEGDALKIYGLLETPRYRERDRQRNQSLALTFVDLLNQGSALRKVAKTLTGDEAPVAPDADDEDENKRFFLAKFLPFQTQALEEAAGKLERLDPKWKAWVLKKRSALARDEERRRETQGDRGRNRRQRRRE